MITCVYDNKKLSVYEETIILLLAIACWSIKPVFRASVK